MPQQSLYGKTERRSRRFTSFIDTNLRRLDGDLRVLTGRRLQAPRAAVRFTLLLLIGVLVTGAGLKSRDLWEPDEPRYAQVAREMERDGNWVVPRLGGTRYTQKPPLLFWMICALGRVAGGINEVAARLPSVISAALLAACVGTFAGRHYGGGAAWLAPLILLTFPRFLRLAQRASPDILLTLFVFLALCSLFSRLSAGRGGNAPRAGFAAGFFFWSALGTLSKGPVGFILPFGIGALGAALHGGRRAVREMGWGRGTLLFAGVVGLWLVPAIAIGGKEYAREILLSQTLGRFLGSGAHEEPFWFYLVRLPVETLPWSLLLPALLVFFIRERQVGREGSGRRPQASGFLLLWIAFVVVFFSLSGEKTARYLLPCAPPLAILTADLLLRGGGPSIAADRLRQFLVCAPVALILVGASAGALVGPLLWDATSERHLGFVIAASGVALCAAIAGWILGKGRAPAAALGPLLAAFLVCYPALKPVFFAEANPRESLKPFCERVSEAVAPGEPLVVYGYFKTSFLYYIGRERLEILVEPEALAGFVSSHGPAAMIMIRRDYDALPVALRRALDPVFEIEHGSRLLMLVRSRGAPRDTGNSG